MNADKNPGESGSKVIKSAYKVAYIRQNNIEVLWLELTGTVSGHGEVNTKVPELAIEPIEASTTKDIEQETNDAEHRLNASHNASKGGSKPTEMPESMAHICTQRGC